jgi:hypothetical protein
MAILSCTKKLFEHSNFSEFPVPEVGYNPLYSWHANLFRVGRKNCLMIMNDLTRYQLVLYGLRKEHYRNFDELFFYNLNRNLRADDFTESEIRLFMNGMGNQLIYTKTHNRSILGSMKDQIYITEYWIEDYLPTEELNIIELNKQLNDSVILKLKEGYAKKALKNVLQVK